MAVAWRTWLLEVEKPYDKGAREQSMGGSAQLRLRVLIDKKELLS